jgi:epoxyqueuosine reductase
LTIENENHIDRELHAGMGNWIFGCDVCQDVCPHNSPRGGDVGSADEAYVPRTTELSLRDVARWTHEARRAAFQGSAMKRADLPMMRRNAAIALGNQPALHENDVRVLRELARDTNGAIADAARSSLARHGLGEA